MNPYESTRKELSDTYVRISKFYVRMSKVSDNYSLNIIQSGIDFELIKIAKLRGELDALMKDMLENWKNWLPNIII